MDQEFRDAFGALGRQVDGVERRLNARIDDVHDEFLAFKRGVIGPTDPPGPHADIASVAGVDAAALAVLNGTKAPTIKERLTGTEGENQKLRADVDRILKLQEAQSKEQGVSASFTGYLRSRSGRKLALQVITAVIVLAGYVEGRMHRELPAASSTPAASSR